MVTLTKLEEKPLVWLLPLVIFLALFYVYPMAEVFRCSFTNSTLISRATEYSIRGYAALLSDSNFYQMLKTTLAFVVGSVVFQVVLGLGISLLVKRGVRRALPGAIACRTAVLACWIIPATAIGIIWKILLSEFNYGIMNYLADSLLGKTFPFLTHPTWALISITIANVWCGTAFSMLTLFGGLQCIPDHLYEAATVDGASAWQQFKYVTIPQLIPFIFIDVTLATIYTFNSFGLILALTGGGPGRATEVLSLNVYTTVFGTLNLGRGCAVAVILLVINLLTAVVYYGIFAKRDAVAE